MKHIFLIIFALFFISSCAHEKTARVQPESLLSASTENISFNLTNSDSIAPIVSWIEEDLPQEAEISCFKKNGICKEIRGVLRHLAVPFKSVNSGFDDSIVLIYERISANNCNSRGFGCSVSVNTLQMVPSLRQFTNPSLSDAQDAQRAVNTYGKYSSDN